VSEVIDRRARKKAQTRTLIRETAQALFAERGFEAVTIADIAAAADVAVQTVFNHFPTKEDLFFDGHTPWVAGPAEAVRSRPMGETPLDALHGYLTGLVGDYLRWVGTPEGRCFVATLEASAALTARERDLHHEAVDLLEDALLQACAQERDVPALTTDPRTSASITAAVWLAAVRTILLENRRYQARPAGGATLDVEREACTVTDQVLSGLVDAMRASTAGRMRRSA
jgi:AcrR family transcriptional regulator